MKFPAIFVFVCLHLQSIYGQVMQSLKPCPSTDVVSCFVIPCTRATCAAFPQAECRNNYCGSCTAEFWDGDTEVTSQCNQVSVGIPSRSQIAVGSECQGSVIQCLMNPCTTATCPNHPNAQCRVDNCKCEARFTDGDVDVTDSCQSSGSANNRVSANSVNGVASRKPCASGMTVQCGISPCVTNRCPNHPDAECRNNYCDECTAEFWVGDQEVTSTCSGGGISRINLDPSRTAGTSNTANIPGAGPPVDPVPDTQCSRFCFFPSCLFGNCPAYPEAECRVDYCNGCQAQYFMGDQEVTGQCMDQIPSLWSRIFPGFRGRFAGRRQASSSTSTTTGDRSFMSPFLSIFRPFF